MFEISGDDISALSDGDLRTLVARLAISELKTKGHPLSSVTMGGNQDAADGGIDVRVACPSTINNLDFIPRGFTGFQVKKSDMPASAIEREMKPKGVLRDSIQSLVASSGAYVIVSGQGSVADKPLEDRREAMRKCLIGFDDDSILHIDFYDRERLAIWVNQYPGIAAWVRSQIGRPLSGWSGIENWKAKGENEKNSFLFDDKACLTEEVSQGPRHLTVAEGIERLRDVLREVKKCVRLIGLSGVGKTRFVEALFEEGVGTEPLDSGLVVYTDYSEEIFPTARDMASSLKASGDRAILIIDNCNPKTHADLAQICSGETSSISLLTVEYDVQGDDPEHTEVFRLESASSDLVGRWLKQNFPVLTQPVIEKICEFSDGNFRVARALAETVRKGDNLASLKSLELFDRIFQQRNEHDGQLLKAAESLALLYSIDGEDVLAGGELAKVADVRGMNASTLFEALVELRNRGIVQARGRFRAILPHAIANPLAARCLDRMPDVIFDQFCGGVSSRMLISISRRLGMLHDLPAAQAIVKRWLRRDGPLGNLFGNDEATLQIVLNIAPVAPEMLLERLEKELNDPATQQGIISDRNRWGRLAKAIGYEVHLFDRAVDFLARLLVYEDKEQSFNSLRDIFEELFHLYLSGTQADPEQRRAAIRRLTVSKDDKIRGGALLAMRALLKGRDFMSLGYMGFGARSRSWGWHPTVQKDIWNWFENAIKLVIELAPNEESRKLIAHSIRHLWHYPNCRDLLDQVSRDFCMQSPWIEGWIAFRETLRFDGKEMPEDIRSRLKQIIGRMEPTDLLSRARAIVLNRQNGNWDVYDEEPDEGGSALSSWERAEQMAENIGFELSNDDEARSKFINELLEEPQALRAFHCGRGLARGANDVEQMWREIVISYHSGEGGNRNPTVLCGFIAEMYQKNRGAASRLLDDAVDDEVLLGILPRLHAGIGVDEAGAARLKMAISRGGLPAWAFLNISNRCIENTPVFPLLDLLKNIADLPSGVEVALDILHMYFHGKSEEDQQRAMALVVLGRELLGRIDLNENSHIRFYSFAQLIGICLRGDGVKEEAKVVCERLRMVLGEHYISMPGIEMILKSLFKVQPHVALDIFLLPDVAVGVGFGLNDGSPIEEIEPVIIEEWAEIDPENRYPRLGECIDMFESKNEDDVGAVSTLFLRMLDKSPDKKVFLGDFWFRMHPRSWSGSLEDILQKRMELLKPFENSQYEDVKAWIAESLPEIQNWIETRHSRNRAREESFE